MPRNPTLVRPTLTLDRAPVACLSAALTILAHLLLMSPLFFGGGSRPRVVHEQGGATSGLPAMTLITLEDEPDTQPSSKAPLTHLADLASPIRPLAPIGSLALGANIPPIDIDPADSSHSAVDPHANDQGDLALMFGRYLGQVVARVDRAWVRPRSAIGSNSFICLVQVVQDHDRAVKEITLKQCNGTTAWQVSLVRAIESASPFPAPPDKSVFSSVLTFEMTAKEFVAGSDADGYEVLRTTAASIPSP